MTIRTFIRKSESNRSMSIIDAYRIVEHQLDLLILYRQRSLLTYDERAKIHRGIAHKNHWLKSYRAKYEQAKGHQGEPLAIDYDRLSLKTLRQMGVR